MGRVEGKVAIITGGALGIGRATCLLLAKEGARVAVTDIQDDAGREIVAEIKRKGGIAQYWHMNVADEREVEQVFALIHADFGKIDILVNNAGITGGDKPSHEIDENDWDRVLKVNAKGVFFGTKHVFPYMKEAGGGSIINLSSIYGLVGGEDPAYHASKGAVRLLTKSDAYYYAKYNIRVNSVHPGYIKTPLFDNMARSYPDGIEAFQKWHENLTPIGRIGESDDVAFGILYLASDESRFVTGSELVIDGGYTSQ